MNCKLVRFLTQKNIQTLINLTLIQTSRFTVQPLFLSSDWHLFNPWAYVIRVRSRVKLKHKIDKWIFVCLFSIYEDFFSSIFSSFILLNFWSKSAFCFSILSFPDDSKTNPVPRLSFDYYSSLEYDS